MKDIKIILLGTQTSIAEIILGQLAAHSYPFEKVILMDHPQNTPATTFYMGQIKPILPIDLFSEKGPYIALLCDKKIPLTFPKKKIPQNAKVIDCTGVISKAPCFIPSINSFNPRVRLICAPSSLSVILAHTLKPLRFKGKNFQVLALIGTSFLGHESAHKLRTQTHHIFTTFHVQEELSTPPLAFNLIPEMIPLEKEITPHQFQCLTHIPFSFHHCFVPIFRGFCIHIRCQVKGHINLKNLYQNNSLIVVLDQTSPDFIMSSAATLNENKIFIHHIQQEKNTLSFWLTGDDLQCGMALNVIKIIQYLENFV